MGKTATNLAIILGIITVAFAGYYVYTQQANMKLDTNSNQQVMQNMLNNTRAFIGYRQTMNQVDLNVQFFEDVRFTSLRSFTTPIQQRPIGRPNPFAETGVNSTPSS